MLTKHAPTHRGLAAEANKAKTLTSKTRAALVQVREKIRQRAVLKRAAEELARLDDAQLRDIGITRYQIEDAVITGRRNLW